MKICKLFVFLMILSTNLLMLASNIDQTISPERGTKRSISTALSGCNLSCRSSLPLTPLVEQAQEQVKLLDTDINQTRVEIDAAKSKCGRILGLTINGIPTFNFLEESLTRCPNSNQRTSAQQILRQIQNLRMQRKNIKEQLTNILRSLV